MFNQTFVDGTGQTSKPYTLFVSTILQAAALGLGILIPLFITQTLPNAGLKSILVAPPPPTPPPVITADQSRPTSGPRKFNAARLAAPITIPKKVLTGEVTEPAPDVSGLKPSENGPAGNSILFGSAGSEVAPVPPPPAAAKTVSKGPTRIGGQVAEANIIRRVEPIYPQLARQARVQGAVEFTAVISKEGRVDKLQLVRGHPLLIAAAREAILQWRYRPTLLNGQPVEVVTSITVNFTLGQ